MLSDNGWFASSKPSRKGVEEAGGGVQAERAAKRLTIYASRRLVPLMVRIFMDKLS